MITDVSRGVRGGSSFGGNVTQPLPRTVRQVVRPFVVSHIAPALPARRPARVSAGTLKLACVLAIFALLNAGDLLSTYAGLNSGLREGNPLMSGLLGHYGFAALIGYKLAVVAAVSVGVFVLRSFSKRIASATIWMCNGLVCAVVILNVLQFTLR